MKWVYFTFWPGGRFYPNSLPLQYGSYDPVGVTFEWEILDNGALNADIAIGSQSGNYWPVVWTTDSGDLGTHELTIIGKLRDLEHNIIEETSRTVTIIVSLPE